MKRDRIIYWTATGFIALAMTFSSFMYFSQNPQMVQASTAIGLPLYLMPLLGTAKLLGAIALIQPYVKGVKEWAYAGFTFIFIGATWIHLATHTPFVAPLVFLAVLGLSYWYYRKLNNIAVM